MERVKKAAPILAWLLLGIAAVSIIFCAAQNTTGLLWRENIEIPNAKLKLESRGSGKYGYVFKTPSQLDLPERLSHLATVTEDGQPLPLVGRSRNDVSQRAQGRYIVKGRAIALSTPDATDPRSNGRSYRASIPVHFRSRTLVRLAIVGLIGIALLAATRAGRGSIIPARQIAANSGTRIDALLSRAFTPYLAAWLAIPSVLLCYGMPPLWKDYDALIQLTNQPGALTIIHFTWLYSFLGHIPGWIVDGALALTGRGTWPGFAFWLPPTPFLPHHAYALILTQHALTWLALAALIRSITASPRVQLLLALLAMCWSPFYSVSHLLGSEYPAMLCMILVASTGLTVLHHQSWRTLLCYGLALAAAIASRHINAVMAIALPLAGLAVALFNRPLDIPFSRRLIKGLGMAALVCGISLAAIFANSAAKRLLAHHYEVTVRSTIGRVTGTREWLKNSPPQEQALWLKQLKATTEDPWAHRALEILASHGQYWDQSQHILRQEIASSTGLTGDALEVECDHAFNAAVIAMLKRLPTPMRNNIIADTRFLFTEFDTGVFMWFPVSRHQKIEASLDRIEGTDMAQSALGGQPWIDYDHRFPHPRSTVAYLLLFQSTVLPHFFAVLLVLVAVVAIRHRSLHLPPGTIWGLSLTLAAVLMMIATNILICFFDRYALPLFILIPIAIMFTLADALQGRPSTLKPSKTQ